jgi:hypothetical protein
MSSGPQRMLCIYRVRPGEEAEFERLLRSHWPTLNQAGLVSPEPARILKAQGRDGKLTFLESFAWKDAGASDRAHQTPRVMALWGPMEALTDDMEFLPVEPLGA